MWRTVWLFVALTSLVVCIRCCEAIGSEKVCQLLVNADVVRKTVSVLAPPVIGIENDSTFLKLKAMPRLIVLRELVAQLHEVSPSKVGSQEYLHVGGCISALEMLAGHRFVAHGGSEFYGETMGSAKYFLASIPEQREIVKHWKTWLDKSSSKKDSSDAQNGFAPFDKMLQSPKFRIDSVRVIKTQLFDDKLLRLVINQRLSKKLLVGATKVVGRDYVISHSGGKMISVDWIIISYTNVAAAKRAAGCLPPDGILKSKILTPYALAQKNNSAVIEFTESADDRVAKEIISETRDCLK
jgi:hypothetical protein